MTRGFTLIELMVTLAIIAVLATLVLPVAQVTIQRQKEQELRLALREIRSALDAYKNAMDDGKIIKPVNSTAYPKTLSLLVEGVPDVSDPKKNNMYFLRRLPRDPMNPDTEADAADSWGKRAYASEPDEPKEGEDVYDVFSKSTTAGLNGVPYNKW